VRVVGAVEMTKWWWRWWCFLTRSRSSGYSSVRQPFFWNETLRSI